MWYIYCFFICAGVSLPAAGVVGQEEILVNGNIDASSVTVGGGGGKVIIDSNRDILAVGDVEFRTSAKADYICFGDPNDINNCQQNFVPTIKANNCTDSLTLILSKDSSLNDMALKEHECPPNEFIAKLNMSGVLGGRRGVTTTSDGDVTGREGFIKRITLIVTCCHF